MRNALKWVSALAATVMLANTAAAQTQVDVGTLTCVGGEGVGLIIGSQKSYACRFESSTTQSRETYQATLTKIGLDIGVTGRTTIERSGSFPLAVDAG